MRKILLLEYKQAYDGTIFDDPPDGFTIELPFAVEYFELEKVRHPLYTQYYLYAVG